MSFTVLGITAGRKDSNSEILLKEALLACEEQGAHVRMINLRDYNIMECSGCTACTQGMINGKNVGCTLSKKDDKEEIMKVMLNVDAIIVSVPTYDLTATATYLKFMHRNLAYESAFLELIGAIEHRDRVAGLISVGGSTRSWQSMALESIQATCFTNDFKVIDMYLATRVPAPKQCLLHDDMIQRAHKMGENIMKSLNTPAKERAWMGEENMGWCPHCHSNALILGEMQWDGVCFPVECQVCGAGGNLKKTEDGKWKFVIQKDGLSRDRTSVDGRGNHLREIEYTQGSFYTKENLAIVKEKFAKYKELKFPGIEIKK
ncbi:flavodoxin family protein [Clostridium sporogenes]|uniref:flavodoxin family protein n=1 Tax=Clostridium sporogenes TaxID=1509 RepID=UPI003DA249BC